jgi:serine protease Do
MMRLHLALLAVVLSANLAFAQSREEKVRADKAKVESEGFWIYNDLPKGFAQAKKSGQPMIVVLRCIPCEECVKLDDELIDQHPAIKPLLEKFVRVRQISTNGLDLNLFQYDYDQSFAVFLLNGDGTIYGRFGTRSHRTDWHDDVSIEGLAKAMEAALKLHADYPANADSLKAKRGPKPEFASPEKFPALKDKFTDQIDYKGQVVKSCIHCHQVGDAIKELYRTKEGKLPEKVLNPYPHPKILGLILDPRECAKVEEVTDGSDAAQAGFRPGDTIVTLEKQPILSIADVQWVLHHTSDQAAELHFVVSREGQETPLTLKAPAGWKSRDDLGWRVSSWQLRRWGTGGILSEAIPAEAREELKLAPGKMALRVKHVGQYAPHNIAQQAGFQKDDVIVAFDGRDDLVRETDLLRYAINEVGPGKPVEVQILRGGKPLTLKMTLPK